jgi:uncharacterized protein (DUF58 family)
MDLRRQVRRLEWRVRHLVDSKVAGEYRSVFKGQGLEFAEVREYQPGDEVRTIDWNVSARMGRPFVRRHVEERELTVMLVVDRSASTAFGTRCRFKDELAMELASVLAFAAVRNNDRVGCLLFSDGIEYALPPRKGRRHVLRLLRDLLLTRPARRETRFAPMGDRLARLLPHRSVVFLLSDFAAPDVEATLARLSRRHEVVAIAISDPLEQQLPDLGLVRLQDPETGALFEIDTGDPAVRRHYAQQRQAEHEARQGLFARLGIESVIVDTREGYVGPLLAFFRRRLRALAPRRARQGPRPAPRPPSPTVRPA